MTTECGRARGDARARAWLACLLLVPACTDAHATRHGDRVDVSSYPKEIQAAYRVFALRCSRCHTLARPLNAHITDPQHWIRYVARMRRQPGSGIDRSNADIILRFLLFYHREPGSPEPPAVPSTDAIAPEPAVPAPNTSAPATAPAPPAPEPPAPESPSTPDDVPAGSEP